MKKLGLFFTLLALFGMFTFSSCKQATEETESTEEVAPAEDETAPMEAPAEEESEE